MNSKTIRNALVLVLSLMPAFSFAQRPRQISIRVVDERDKPVEGAEVSARYLATIREGDKERFSFYAIPGELNRARIVVELANRNRVLELKDVSGQSTADGLRFDFDTNSSDYVLK